MNLKELARHLQLSQTTVSRALNGYPEVNEQTRARVRQAAEELNYRPRRHAQQLATGRSMVIGHVVTRSRHALIAPLFADLMAGAGEAADSLGYDSHFRIVDDDLEIRHYRELVAARRVDGVVVHGPLCRLDPRIDLLNELRLPFIVHGQSEESADYAWLDVDNAGAMRRATSLLIDLGHTDIGFVNGPESLHFAYRRRKGFMDALAAHGLEPNPDWIFSGPLVEHHGFAAARALLDDGQPPTALVCAGLLPAWGVLRELLTRRLVLGRDFSIVAYDDSVSWLANRGSDCENGAPLFTTVRSSIHLAGQRLIHHLVRSIEEPGQVTVAETLPTELVIGQSTGRRPDRQAACSMRRTSR